MDDKDLQWLVEKAAAMPPALRRAVRCHLRAFGELRSRRLTLAASRRDPFWAGRASPELLDREFTRRLVSADGRCLISLPREWQQDKEIATIAVRQHPIALL